MTAWFVKEARTLAAKETNSVQQIQDIKQGNHDGMPAMKALIKLVKENSRDPYLEEARNICANWVGVNSKYHEDYLLGNFDNNAEIKCVYETLVKYDVEIKP